MASFSDIIQLFKLRLTMSVVFSALAGYLIAFNEFDGLIFLYLLFGGFLLVAGSNGFNQILEKKYDKVMSRTANRPLPTNRMTIRYAFYLSVIISLAGIFLLYRINFLCGFFGTISIILYVLFYTPLKRLSSVSVFVGSFPGAIPFMLGWVAVTNDFDIEPGFLFAIQFIWQFPHFWSIAWVCHDDYKKAGFKMLPGEKNQRTAWKSVLYCSFLIPLSVLPYFGIIGSLKLSLFSVFILLFLGFWFVRKAVFLFKNLDNNSAKKLMFASFIYLPLLQLIYIFDKLLL